MKVSVKQKKKPLVDVKVHPVDVETLICGVIQNTLSQIKATCFGLEACVNTDSEDIRNKAYHWIVNSKEEHTRDCEITDYLRKRNLEVCKDNTKQSCISIKVKNKIKVQEKSTKEDCKLNCIVVNDKSN